MSTIKTGSTDFDQELQSFKNQRFQIFETLFIELAEASTNFESADFGSVFKHAKSVLGKSDLEMSRLFKVSQPTISRWTRGVTAPHPFLRKAVFDVLVAEVQSIVKTLKSAS